MLRIARRYEDIHTPVPFWDRPLHDTIDSVSATPGGLTTVEAERRRAQYGANDLAKHRANLLLEILLFLANPLVLILLVAAGISGAVGEYLTLGSSSS